MSPVLFNVYLENALDSSQKLKELRKRGDLLAFADDMLIMSNQKGEIEQAINEMTSLQIVYNLRLNKKKSEILTTEKEEQIAEVKCTRMVKYLGVKINADVKLQRSTAKEKIHRNLNTLKWRLKEAEPDVLQQLTCCLARSLLIYIGTPMVVAGLWKRKDIDALEASLYRKILFLSRGISNKAILKTMTSIRLVGEAINNLANRTREETER